jgi:hypothetical protein
VCKAAYSYGNQDKQPWFSHIIWEYGKYGKYGPYNMDMGKSDVFHIIHINEY